MRRIKSLKVMIILAGMLLLAACAEPALVPGTGPGAAVTPSPVVLPSETPALPTVSPEGTATGGPAVITLVPAGSETATPGTPAETAAVEPGGAGQVPGSQSVTLADDGKTINLKVGERFLLNLGEGFDWTPLVADQSIVSRVPNISVIRGAQGIYEAHAAGQTLLTVNGEPTCRQSKPACGQPNRAFQVTLVVQ